MESFALIKIISLICLQIRIVASQYQLFNPLYPYMRNPLPLRSPNVVRPSMNPNYYGYMSAYLQPATPVPMTSSVEQKGQLMWKWNGFRYIPFYTSISQKKQENPEALQLSDKHKKIVEEVKNLVSKLSDGNETGLLDRLGVAKVLSSEQIKLLISTNFQNLKPEDSKVPVDFLAGYIMALNDIGNRVNESMKRLNEAKEIVKVEEEKKKESTMGTQPMLPDMVNKLNVDDKTDLAKLLLEFVDTHIHKKQPGSQSSIQTTQQIPQEVANVAGSIPHNENLNARVQPVAPFALPQTQETIPIVVQNEELRNPTEIHHKHHLTR